MKSSPDKFDVFVVKPDLQIGGEGDRLKAEFLTEDLHDPRVKVYGPNVNGRIVTLGIDVERPWKPHYEHGPYDFDA